LADQADDPVLVLNDLARLKHGPKRIYPAGRGQSPQYWAAPEIFRIDSPGMTDREPTTERHTVKGRPTLVLALLIGSCFACGYAIYCLLKGMHM